VVLVGALLVAAASGRPALLLRVNTAGRRPAAVGDEKAGVGAGTVSTALAAVTSLVLSAVQPARASAKAKRVGSRRMIFRGDM
jgi:hypothetical protein